MRHKHVLGVADLRSERGIAKLVLVVAALVVISTVASVAGPTYTVALVTMPRANLVAETVPRGWTRPLEIAKLARGVGNDLAIHNGRAHVTFSGRKRPGGDNILFYGTNATPLAKWRVEVVRRAPSDVGIEHPSIALGSGGKPYIAYQLNAPTPMPGGEPGVLSASRVMVATRLEGVWGSRALALATGNGTAHPIRDPHDPEIAVGEDGIATVVFEAGQQAFDGRGCDQTSFGDLYESHGSGSEWSVPVNLTFDDRDPSSGACLLHRDPALVAHGGGPQLVYIAESPQGWSLRHRSIADPPREVTITSGVGSTVLADEVVLVAHPAVHLSVAIAVSDDTDQAVFHATDRSGTWESSEIARFTTAEGLISDVSIASRAGSPAVAWVLAKSSPEQLLLARRTATGWTLTELAESPGPLRAPRLGAIAGQLHATLWRGTDPTSLRYLHEAPAPRIRISTSKRLFTDEQPVLIRGSVKPASIPERATVRIQRFREGAWRGYDKRSVRTTADGLLRLRHSHLPLGQFRVRIEVGDSIDHLAGKSRWRKFRVETWITLENRKPGTRGWQIHSEEDHGIIGYAAPISASAGRNVRLYISTPAARFRVKAFRIGHYQGLGGRLIWTSRWKKGRVQRGPHLHDKTNMVEAHWRPSVRFRVSAKWPPGEYLLKLYGSNGGRSYIPFVRLGRRHADLLITNNDTTWQAYNLWGGYSLYRGRDGSFQNRSRVVSFDRPYEAGKGTHGFLSTVLPITRLVEKLGLDVSYWTDVDLHRNPRAVRRHRALVFLNHDEYWSSRMRAGALRARARGVNIAIFGGNTGYRHIRFASSPRGRFRREISYKVAREDPLYGINNKEVTVAWREPPVPRPESVLNGAIYECNPVAAAGRVVSARDWVFKGAGLRNGERLESLVWVEYDRVNPAFPTPRRIKILMHSPLTCRGRASHADMTYYTTRSKAGVVNVSTLGWFRMMTGCSGACSGSDSRAVRQITTNILTDFAKGPAGRRHPSRSNLSRFGIRLRRPINP